jgi:RHS repeat-associated protein
VAFTYDANGNCTHILQSGSFTDNNFYGVTEMEFQYNADDKLIEFRYDGSGNWNEIQYDALGRVIERVDTSSVSSKYYYDQHQLIQQLDSSNEVDFDYFAGPLGLMRQIDETGAGDDKRFYILDGKRTVKALIDPSDLSIKHYNYNSFGEHLEKDSAFPSESNVIRYIGSRLEGFAKPSDAKGALYHLGHRHYLAQLGMFLQRDPLYTAISPKAYYAKDTNPYGYSGNNPVMKVDRHGLIPCSFNTGPGNNILFYSGCFDPLTGINMSTGWKHGTNHGSCECDQYPYMNFAGFLAQHFWGWNGVSPQYYGVYQVPLIVLTNLCYLVNSGVTLDILMSGALCCEVLRMCKICTPQKVADEFTQLTVNITTHIWAAYSTTYGCLCSIVKWENSDPATAINAEIFCASWKGKALYPYSGHNCDCIWWQDWEIKYLKPRIGKPGGTRCWGYCATDWTTGTQPGAVGHSWVTLYPDLFIHPTPVREFDVWAYGQNFVTRGFHEQLWTASKKTFRNCVSGSGQDVNILVSDPGY